MWIERIGFAHDHGHGLEEDESSPHNATEQSVNIGGGDPVFTDRGKELDLSQMEKDGDLEDIFKYELAEKKAKTKAIS